MIGSTYPSEAVVAISAAATLVHHIEGIVTVVEAVVALKAHSLVGPEEKIKT